MWLLPHLFLTCFRSYLSQSHLIQPSPSDLHLASFSDSSFLKLLCDFLFFISVKFWNHFRRAETSSLACPLSHLSEIVQSTPFPPHTDDHWIYLYWTAVLDCNGLTYCLFIFVLWPLVSIKATICVGAECRLVQLDSPENTCLLPHSLPGEIKWGFTQMLIQIALALMVGHSVKSTILCNFE